MSKLIQWHLKWGRYKTQKHNADNIEIERNAANKDIEGYIYSRRYVVVGGKLKTNISLVDYSYEKML